jgi:TolB-like protein/cytochrome c-type biogenesis protein CcmH/NrfG
LTGKDEEGTHTRLREHLRVLIDPKISEHRGRIVKNTGDGMLVEFGSVVECLRCAIEIQRGMNERNIKEPQENRIEFRIGINVGDVILDGGDIFGDGVNVAARLEGIAEPGGICISDDTHRQVRDKIDIAFEDAGEQQFKNIARPVRVHRVRLDTAAAMPRPVLALPDKPSIAVLPFQNMSGDPEQEYFAEGLVEDIITALSGMRWLFVIARNSSFTYKGRAVDVKQVGRELGVRYVLEGSVRKGANRVRITGQLVDALTGAHLWAKYYDRELTDIFAVQDEITEQVVVAIEPHLYAAEGARAKRKPPESLDAWECVIRSLSLIDSRAKADIVAARKLLQKAIVLDPGYARAYSLLAFATTLGVASAWERKLKSALALASDAAYKALFLDIDDPWAHVALGYVLVWSRRPGEAIVELEKALALNPNFAIGHYLLAIALCYLGRGEEALAHSDNAVRLSPRDLWAGGSAGISNQVHSLACWAAGRYCDGIEFARKAIIESPNLTPAYRLLVMNCALAGEIEEARAALQSLKRLVPEFSQKWIEEVSPWVRDEDRQRHIEAFRLAGLE